MPCSHDNWGWERDTAVSSTPGRPTVSLLQHLWAPWIILWNVDAPSGMPIFILALTHVQVQVGLCIGEQWEDQWRKLHSMDFFFFFLYCWKNYRYPSHLFVGWLLLFFPLTLSTHTRPSQAFTLDCLFPYVYQGSLVNHSHPFHPWISIDVPSYSVTLSLRCQLSLSCAIISS